MRHALCSKSWWSGAMERRRWMQPEPELIMDRRRQESRLERFARTKQDIAERLAAACADMSSNEFDALVTHMAELQIKYTLRRSADLFPEVLEWERGEVDVTEHR
jgi:hypothetical protein